MILEAITLGTRVLCSPGCNVGHLVPLVNVVELDQLSMNYFEGSQPLYNNVNIRSFDSGREKLKVFFNGNIF